LSSACATSTRRTRAAAETPLARHADERAAAERRNDDHGNAELGPRAQQLALDIALVRVVWQLDDVEPAVRKPAASSPSAPAA